MTKLWSSQGYNWPQKKNKHYTDYLYLGKLRDMHIVHTITDKIINER